MSIVIVDDSMTNLVVLKHLAKAQSDRAVITFSGALAARQHLREHNADLVIVDCEMPELNGIDFISEMRQLPHHAETPVVMVTNHVEREIRLNALAAGATEFLSKPVEANEFKLRVRNLLRLGASSPRHLAGAGAAAVTGVSHRGLAREERRRTARRSLHSHIVVEHDDKLQRVLVTNASHEGIAIVGLTDTAPEAHVNILWRPGRSIAARVVWARDGHCGLALNEHDDLGLEMLDRLIAISDPEAEQKVSAAKPVPV